MTDKKQDLRAELMVRLVVDASPMIELLAAMKKLIIDATYEARIADLEAQLEAVGAGGVGSGIVSLVGWQFVPTEDTPSMWTAGGKAIKNCAGHSRDAASLAYKAMLAAAPQPQPHQIAEPASGWISVDERLPDFEVEVLTCHWYCNSEQADVGIHWRDDPDVYGITGNTANFLLGSARDVTVTHWMPLPAPYSADTGAATKEPS